MRINLSLQRLKLRITNCKLLNIVFMNKLIDSLNHDTEITMHLPRLVHRKRPRIRLVRIIKIAKLYPLHLRIQPLDRLCYPLCEPD
ncbi:hypothetical protein D3C79_1035000 [compost metagenome]